MKMLACFGLAAAIVCSLDAAEPGSKSEVRGAINGLANQPSYSWTATPKAEGPGSSTRQGPTEGKTERNGYTYFRLTVGENAVEAAFKGNRSAIKSENDWESSDELQGDREWGARRLKAFKTPAAEADELLTKTSFLRKEQNGIHSGDLTAEGARELIAVRNQTAGKADGPRNAKGSVKFWVKDGALIKYQYNLQGKVIGQDLQEHEINRTTTVEIKNVGATKVQVPEGALKKLP